MSEIRSSRTLSATPIPGGPDRPRRAHLHQVDVVRLLTFASVIGVHSVAVTTYGSSVGAGAVLVLLHFTRETFFLLSAFVLVHSTRSAERLALGRFWGRRIFYTGLPYLVWTVLYWALVYYDQLLTPHALGRLAYDLPSGNAKYHLYFLLVSIQLYLVFGLLRWLVRRTQGHHRALFAVALVLELALLAWVHWAPPTTGVAGWLVGYDDSLFPTYVFYFVAGALAAWHLESFDAWTRRHRRTLVATVLAGAALALGTYAVQVAAGMDPTRAAEPLQPVLVAWSVAASLGLYAVGTAFADRRRSGSRLARAVTEGSLISFGVYLVHPAVLVGVTALGLGAGSTLAPSPVRAALAWVAAAVVSTAFVELVTRTPLSLPLTGRAQRPRRGGSPA